MIKFNRIKAFLFFSFTIVLFLMSGNELYAESVFLKDGSIIEGNILKEDDRKIEVRTETGEKMTILRKDFIRTLYHSKYKDKKIIKKNNGVTIEAYIVDEDIENCIYRIKLNSPEEIRISKDDIDSISRYKGKSADEEIVVKKEEKNVKKKDEKKPEVDSITPAGYYMRGIIPGWGQFYSGHNVKGTLFGLSFACAATWAVIANMNYSKSKDDYDSLTSANSQAEFDSAFDKSEKDGKTALWATVTTAAIYVLNWIDILYFSNPENGESVSMLRYGDTYFDFNLIPDNMNKNYNISSAGLKAEMNVSVRF